MYKYSSNITFGTNTNIFRRISDNLYSFNIFACTSGIFKLKKDDRKETSLFEINNGEVETSSYSFNRVLKGRTDKVATTFNITDPSTHNSEATILSLFASISVAQIISLIWQIIVGSKMMKNLYLSHT